MADVSWAGTNRNMSAVAYRVRLAHSIVAPVVLCLSGQASAQNSSIPIEAAAHRPTFALSLRSAYLFSYTGLEDPKGVAIFRSSTNEFILGPQLAWLFSPRWDLSLAGVADLAFDSYEVSGLKLETMTEKYALILGATFHSSPIDVLDSGDVGYFLGGGVGGAYVRFDQSGTQTAAPGLLLLLRGGIEFVLGTGASRKLLQLGPALASSNNALKQNGSSYATLSRLSFGMDASFSWLW
jgi:hypothetical protein